MPLVVTKRCCNSAIRSNSPAAEYYRHGRPQRMSNPPPLSPHTPGVRVIPLGKLILRIASDGSLGDWVQRISHPRDSSKKNLGMTPPCDGCEGYFPPARYHSERSPRSRGIPAVADL